MISWHSLVGAEAPRSTILVRTAVGIIYLAIVGAGPLSLDSRRAAQTRKSVP
jgi:hypothetical protein